MTELLVPVEVGDELFMPVEVDGAIKYRVVSVRDEIEPLRESTVEPVQVEPARPARQRRADGLLAVIHGRFANPGDQEWHTIRSPIEAKFLNIRGESFLERVNRDAFTFAVLNAEHNEMPRLLLEHGTAFEGRKPLGRIRSLHANGMFTADLFDTSYTRELVPALLAGQYGMSYAPSGVIKGELAREPKKSERNPRGLPEWTLHSVERLREISICLWPADSNTRVGVLTPDESAAPTAA